MDNTLLAVAFVVFGLVDLALLHVMRDKFPPLIKKLVLGGAVAMFLIAVLLYATRSA